MKARDVIFGLLGIAAVADLGRAFGEMQMQAHMLGQLEVVERDLPHRAAFEPVFSALPFQEAIDFFERKQVMSPAEFRDVEDRYKAKGFSMAGVHSRYVLETAHRAIGDSIADGSTEHEALGRIRSAFSSAGVADPGDFHLQTTFDGAVLGSYAAGRYTQLTHPDVLRARPFWKYHTAGDNRVRPAHRAMNGRVFRADDPVWQTWYPPNGYRCRCGVDSVSQSEVERDGIEVQDHLPQTVAMGDGTVAQMLPDPGFSGSPATQIAADATTERIRGLAHRTGALSETELDRATDAERRAKVDRFAGLTEAGVEHRLGETPVFNVYQVYQHDDEPAPHGEYFVDWNMYSQNLDSAEQLVSRLVQTHGLYGLKDRIGLVARASYLSSWDPKAWPDPEVVYDDALARRLGQPAGMTTARSTEYAIRLRVRHGELGHVLAFLDQNGERGEGKDPVRRAWDVADVRVRAGAGAELPETATFKRAYRNVRHEETGRATVTLSKEPIQGFGHAEPIAVNASLWRYLP